LTLPAQVELPAGTLSLSFPVTPARLTTSTAVTVTLYYEGGAHSSTNVVTVDEAPPGWDLYLPTIQAR